MASPAPPNFLDTIERYLLRAILGGLVVLVLLLGFAWWQAKHAPATTRAGASGAAVGAGGVAAVPATTTITLVIDFGDGTQRRFTDLAFAPGMTVVDAMRAAAAHARPLVFESKGSGPGAIITSIEGIRDEGAGTNPGAARAWQYWVNAAYGETSAGAAALKAGDRVSWAFRPYAKDLTPPP